MSVILARDKAARLLKKPEYANSVKSSSVSEHTSRRKKPGYAGFVHNYIA